MDGRHFGEEFVRRKRLAEKGVIVEKQPSLGFEIKSSSGSGGGWSEVAKKGSGSGAASTVSAPFKETESIQSAGFKVVPSRKKGKK